MQPDVPDALVGDAGRLRQVLLNLTGNAVKFTDEGEVLVHVEIGEGDGPPSSQGAAEVALRFTVRDTGIGVPPDQQERIFRAFEQEDTSTTRKYGGTGLGLTIASRLVAVMGGTITLDSAPGRGSTFTFTARFGRQPSPPESVPAQPPVSLHNLPVLVVDDKGIASGRRATGVRCLCRTSACSRTCALSSLSSAACGGDPTLLGKMCQTLTARVPEHLTALRDALPDQDSPRLREAAHKSCGMLSEFSKVAGELAGSLEDIAAGMRLDQAGPILEQLETMAHELVKQIGGMTVEALRRQPEALDEHDRTVYP